MVRYISIISLCFSLLLTGHPGFSQFKGLGIGTDLFKVFPTLESPSRFGRGELQCILRNKKNFDIVAELGYCRVFRDDHADNVFNFKPYNYTYFAEAGYIRIGPNARFDLSFGSLFLGLRFAVSYFKSTINYEIGQGLWDPYHGTVERYYTVPWLEEVSGINFRLSKRLELSLLARIKFNKFYSQPHDAAMDRIPGFGNNKSINVGAGCLFTYYIPVMKSKQ